MYQRDTNHKSPIMSFLQTRDFAVRNLKKKLALKGSFEMQNLILSVEHRCSKSRPKLNKSFSKSGSANISLLGEETSNKSSFYICVYFH
jgi:hypothetical protein